jgi:hypothetical protein
MYNRDTTCNVTGLGHIFIYTFERYHNKGLCFVQGTQKKVY